MIVLAIHHRILWVEGMRHLSYYLIWLFRRQQLLFLVSILLQPKISEGAAMFLSDSATWATTDKSRNEYQIWMSHRISYALGHSWLVLWGPIRVLNSLISGSQPGVGSCLGGEIHGIGDSRAHMGLILSRKQGCSMT